MEILVLKIEYDGTDYSGWQSQSNAHSVQSALQNASAEIFGKKLSIIGSGRTDAGVHARGQIAHTVLKEKIKLSEKQIPKAFNHYLNEDVKVLNAKILEQPFHAVRDAIQREYTYSVHFVNSPLLRQFSTFLKYPYNKQLLFKSAEVFRGEHDFTSFSKNNKETESYVCNVRKCYWEETGFEQYRLTIAANRFVYGMVRAVTGAMLDIARGKRTIEEVAAALAKKDRALSSPHAPAKGLVLEKVSYPPKFALDEF